MTQSDETALLELVPCPFCGGPAEIVSSSGWPHGHPLAGGTRRGECLECGTNGPAECAPNYGEVWNKRAALSLPARREGILSDGEIYSRASFDSADHKRGFVEGMQFATRPPVAEDDATVERALAGLPK